MGAVELNLKDEKELDNGPVWSRPKWQCGAVSLNPASTTICCCDLEKLLDTSEPQFPHPLNRGDNVCFVELL